MTGERRLIGPPHAHRDGPCGDECYEPVTEPERADASPVLDLVRQYGAQIANRVEAIENHSDESPFEHAAETLFARIAALVPQQPGDELRALLLPVWQEFASSPDEPGNDTLVRWVQRMIESRERDRQALKDMMVQAERQRQPSAPDFLASINTLTIQRDEARGESEKRLDALIKARAEVERLRSKLERGHVCTPACSPNRHVAHVGRHAFDEALAEVERLTSRVRHLEVELAGTQQMLDVMTVQPPREPRTFPAVEPRPSDLLKVKVAGKVWTYNPAWARFDSEDRRERRSFIELRTLGEVIEVIE